MVATGTTETGEKDQKKRRKRMKRKRMKNGWENKARRKGKQEGDAVFLSLRTQDV